MEAAHATPNVLALAKDPERLARLEEANKLLEEIQKVRQQHLQFLMCFNAGAVLPVVDVGCSMHTATCVSHVQWRVGNPASCVCV